MARGVTEHDSLDTWLGHKKGGGGGKFLSRWKKDKGHVDTWMHTKCLPLEVWRHNFPMYEIVEDRETKDKEKHVFPKKFVCHEDANVLENPWRDKVTGERKAPPKRCGLCKFDEWLWQQCAAWMETHEWDDEKKAWKLADGVKKSLGLDPCTDLFKFISEASDDEKRSNESVTLRAGGICGYLSQKDMPDGLLKAMKKAKIHGDVVWKENGKVRCESIFCVVDNDNIAAGVQIAVETEALGTKVKEVIKDIWKSQEINIQKTPYCIQWEYFEKKMFSDKYKATAMLKIKPSDRVLKLVRGEAPDLSKLKETFNQQSMRAVFERHCLVKEIPWDEIFPSKEQEKKWSDADREEEEAEEKESEEDASDESDAADDDASDEDDSDEEEESEEDEMVECDECHKPIKITDPKCEHCGHKYETSDEAPVSEPIPPKKMLSRSEVAAKKKTASAKSSKKKSKEEGSSDESEGDSQGAKLPF